MANIRQITPITRRRTHPGEVLREEFMVPLALSANALARALHVPPNRITAIIAAERPRAVTPDTALRLARYFGTTAQFWLNLQRAHDLSAAEIALAGELATIIPRQREAA
jgi:addiction module HigA family antidote